MAWYLYCAFGVIGIGIALMALLPSLMFWWGMLIGIALGALLALLIFIIMAFEDDEAWFQDKRDS